MIGTTYKQAKRLFRAGVDVKASDLFSDGHSLHIGNLCQIEDEWVRKTVYPVWSSDALYNMLPFCIHSDVDGKDYYKELFMEDSVCYVNHEKVGDLSKISYMHTECEGDLVENLVSMIIWFKEGVKQDEPFSDEEVESWMRDCER